MILPNLIIFLILILAFNILSLAFCAFILFRFDKLTKGGLHGDYQIEHELRKIAARLSEKLDGDFDDVLASVKQEIISKIEKHIELFATSGRDEMKGLSTFIEEQHKTVVNESQFLIANSLSRVQRDLEDYKKNQLSRIDQEITTIVFSAAREVLGRAISASEHEDLVSKALERAKKNKFFS